MRWFVWLAVWMAAPAMALEIQPFSQSQLQDEQQQTVSSYRLVAGGLTRTQATTVPSRELRLNGTLWRRVWAVEPRFSLTEVATHFQRQLEALPTLYQCRALDCGSSHFWANEIFRNARLVGREQFQLYRVAVQQEPGSDRKILYVLYVMQRGTRQVMVNLDILTTTDAVSLNEDLSTLVRQQLSLSHGWLPGFEVQRNTLDVTASAPLLQVLKELPAAEKARLYLIVHCYDGNRMDENMRCSDALAGQLRQAVDGGPGQLNVQGLGALTAPPGEIKPALRFVFWPAR